MKYFVGLFIIACFLISGVNANTRLTFQNPEDFSAQVAGINDGYCGSSSYTFNYTYNNSGDNSYMTTGNSYCCGCCGGAAFLIESESAPITYAAATVVSYGAGWYGASTIPVKLYNSTHALLGTLYTEVNPPFYSRIEVMMLGNTAYIFVNGTKMVNNVTLNQNPYYIGFGSLWGTGGCYSNGQTNWDDVVWGSSDTTNVDASDKYVFGMPGNGFFLMKDILNPAASGFYRTNWTDPNGTPELMSSFYMPSTYAKGNTRNETVVLNNYGGADYQGYNTGTNMSGHIYWDLQDFFADSSPNHSQPVPYGMYVTTIHDSTTTYSDIIPYIGSGAVIYWDKDQYGIGEEAKISVEVSDGYYDTDAYTYHVKIQDIFGTEIDDQPISFTSYSPHSGDVHYVWQDDDDEGIYYALMYATRNSDDEELLMNYDVAELTSDLFISGYVKDAPSAAALPNATISIGQGITMGVYTSGSDGNYTSPQNWGVDAPTTLNATCSGYENYSTTFTPLAGGALQLNVSMMPLNPPHDEIAVGGLVMKPPYNQTIDNARVDIYNATLGTTYTVTTNGAGYYIQDYMPNAMWWNIWGSKSGFANSTIYLKYVFGV